MKNFLLAAMLGLMGCSSPWPKFRNPVVVNADKSPIYAGASGSGEVVAIVNQGDTLEFNSWDVIGEPAPGICAVKRDARYNGFKTNAKVGYIKRNLLSIPDSTIAKWKAGKLRGMP